MQITPVSRNDTSRSRAWRKYLGRGAVLLATGFVLAWVGYWAELRWVQWLAFGIGVIGQVHIMIGGAYATQRWWAAYFEWFDVAYQRNIRAAEAKAAGESATPRRPNDR